ncbi:MAG: tape measure protein, partial [Clostridiales bacterium]|nr:tape measure protein [Clostridiales bacterium]
MSSIDERIVQMQFDNKQFESGVATTIKSLDNLKNSLNLEGATKGFSNIEKSAKNVSLDSLANSVENISSKFNALSVVAVTVLQNITNQALSAAKSLVSAFTITPITDGLSEYETQINAIQTIYSNTSSKGTTLDQINTALDELNTYADKTIYNFTEMTRNIGTFTAAGVDLDTSVAAIKGIANLAAASGSTSQQASTAMYQLSQALATGTVKLMDWNSVVNAGMGGQLFQDSLLETARVHGIAVDDMIAKEGSFRESLSEGWLTSEVLLETLQKFTGDLSEEQLRSIGYTDDQIQSIIELGQNANDAATKVKTLTQLFDTLKEAAGSGWTQSWEIIIGDFEQARELWTGVSDTLSNIINNSAEARNNLLSAAFGERTFTSEDWAEISLTNSASTLELFKEQIIAVAKAHDVAIDDMIESEGSFAATLSSGWLTQDILTEALENIQNGSVSATASLDELGEVADRVIRGEFGNGQDRVEALTEAGYDYASVQALVNNKLLGTEVALDELSDTELENLGYTEEQIEALREFAATVDESGKTLNEVLAEMERPSGRTLLIESFANAWSGLVKVINAVGTAWNNVVPAFTSDTLYNALESLHSFSEVLIISDETADKITRTFQGLFAILDIVGQAVSALVGGFVDFIKFIAPAGDGVLSITGGIGDFIYAIDQALRETNLFNNIVKNIGTILAPVGNVIKAFASLLLDSVTGFIDFANADNVVVGVIESIGESLTPVSDLLSEGIEKVASFVAGLIQFADEHELVAKAVTAVKTALSTGISIASKWIDAFMNLPIVQSAIENIETTLNHLSECIEKALSGSYKKFSEFWNDLVSADGSGFEGIGNVFSNIVSTLSSAASGVIEFVQEIISSITSFKTDVSTNLDSVGSTFTAFKDTVSNAFSTLLDKLAGLDWGTIALVAGFLTTFAVAVKVVATTLKIVDAVADGIEGIGNLLSGIGSFGKSIGKIGKTLEKAATSLSKTVKQFKLTLTAQAISQIAAAIFKLVSAIAILAFLPQDKLLNGVFTITILMVGLVGVSKALSMMSIDASVTGVIISFAVAVYILASAVKSLAKLNLTDAVKSVVIIGALMLELAGTIRIMNG